MLESFALIRRPRASLCSFEANFLFDFIHKSASSRKLHHFLFLPLILIPLDYCILTADDVIHTTTGSVILLSFLPRCDCGRRVRRYPGRTSFLTSLSSSTTKGSLALFFPFLLSHLLLSFPLLRHQNSGNFLTLTRSSELNTHLFLCQLLPRCLTRRNIFLCSLRLSFHLTLVCLCPSPLTSQLKGWPRPIRKPIE